MGQVETLRKLVLSGKQENLEMVRQLVLSPRLHKARGVLLRCNVLISQPIPDGGGIWAMIQAREPVTCKNQPRRRCVKCDELMCQKHLTDEGRCHVCLGMEDYAFFTVKKTVTMADFERWIEAFTNQSGY